MNYESIVCTTHRENIKEISCRDVIILYNVENILNVLVNDKHNVLKPNDVMIINQNSDYSCLTDHGFYVKYALNANDLRSCFADKKYTFICDSSKGIGGNYDRLRKILAEILVVLQVRHKYRNVKLNQLFYDLVFFLLSNFAIENIDSIQSEKSILIDYVDNHYFEELSLQDMSEAFNMTSQYFSKYFKKHVGVQFLKYLTNVRLEHAYREVLNSNKRIMSIAMDNGFPNVGAFNHSFKEKYGQTPKDFRDTLNKKEKDEITFNQEYLYAIQNIGAKPEINTSTSSIEVDANLKKTYTSFWNKMIHFGDSSMLDSAQIIKQLREIKSTLDFEYIRLILDKTIYKTNGTFNFVREEMRFSELYHMGFKIWLQVEYRDIHDIDGYCEYLRAFLSYMSRQWSIHTIREWYFELSYNSIFDDKKSKQFCEYAFKIVEVLKIYGCEDNFIIAGLSLSNKEGINYFYDYLKRNHIVFENQSFIVEPYVYYRDENNNEMMKVTAENDVHQDLLMLEETNDYYQEFVKKTYITSWRDNLQQCNVMNDSCYKGAIIIKNFLDCFGQIDSLSQNVALDSMYDIQLQSGVLFGGNGLMNYHGIKKPTYYAYLFMSHVGDWFLDRNENIAVFTNDFGNYHIIAHNCKRLGYRYFMEEDELSVSHIQNYFEDTESLEIHICIHNVENGIYEIKRRSINQNRGSIQDELIRMQGEGSTYIHPHDIEFLNNISIPYITLKEIEVTNHILEIDVVLDANEFDLLHIIHQN